jgi:hypothetical protein
MLIDDLHSSVRFIAPACRVVLTFTVGDVLREGETLYVDTMIDDKRHDGGSSAIVADSVSSISPPAQPRRSSNNAPRRSTSPVSNSEPAGQGVAADDSRGGGGGGSSRSGSGGTVNAEEGKKTKGSLKALSPELQKEVDAALAAASTLSTNGRMTEVGTVRLHLHLHLHTPIQPTPVHTKLIMSDVPVWSCDLWLATGH